MWFQTVINCWLILQFKGLILFISKSDSESSPLLSPGLAAEEGRFFPLFSLEDKVLFDELTDVSAFATESKVKYLYIFLAASWDFVTAWLCMD